MLRGFPAFSETELFVQVLSIRISLCNAKAYWNVSRTVKHFLNQFRTDKDERDPAIDMAIRAINRQFVKRKPVTEGFYGGKYCPICGDSVKKLFNDHCNDCGQALDWGEGKADG